MHCMALKVYTCGEAANEPKTFVNIFCILQTFATKRTFPSLRVVLILISTHPNMVESFVPTPGLNLGFNVGEI
jgi:hypothetical protein